MVTGVVTCVLDTLGVRRGRVAVLKDVPAGNGNWLVEMPGGQRAVLRRYHRGPTLRSWRMSMPCSVTSPVPDGRSRARSVN